MKKLLLILVLTLSIPCFANTEERQPKILVGSPIRQKPAILKEFLSSLENLEKNTFSLDYCFVNDNTCAESTQLLNAFSEKNNGSCILLEPETPTSASCYITNEITHLWSDEIIWKVAAFKDRIIKYAVDNNYDYLFLIDSDLVLHPKTLEQLLSDQKGIVCNIFWTSWSPNTMEMPQVWMQDEYNFYEVIKNQKPTNEEAAQKTYAFMDKLKMPGVYEVGGLGACTLIDRDALLKKVSFKKIKNVSFWGEDRHFCIRAAALDIPLYVDTHYPALHIYRESDLSKVEEYKNNCRPAVVKTQEKKPRVTLSMCIKNEADKYLKEVLNAAKEYITDAVIIDDGSTDNSVEICREILGNLPLKIVINNESKFERECLLREQQWVETAATNPDWILCLDADQIFEQKMKDCIRDMVENPKADAYYFRLYDFWSPTHYREDIYWSAHHMYRPFLIKYNPNATYTFRQTSQHCGTFPLEIDRLSYHLSDLRLKHFGWALEKDRLSKYERYMKLDPDAKYGWKEQYDSILDKDPHLVEWVE